MSRRLQHIRFIGLAADKRTINLGLMADGVGSPVHADLETVNAVARDLLAAGHAIKRGGLMRPPPNQVAMVAPIECDQIQVATEQGTGLAVLRLRFGATELDVRLSTTDIRMALELLEKGSTGGLHQPPTGTQ